MAEVDCALIAILTIKEPDILGNMLNKKIQPYFRLLEDEIHM